MSDVATTDDRGASAAGRAEGRRARVRRPDRALPSASCTPTATGCSGSVYDADDAMQDADAARVEGAQALRGPQLAAQLALHDRHQHLPDADPAPPEARAAGRLRPGDGPVRRAPGQPITETVWIEPYPDTDLEDGLAGPDARYEQRESIELAFIAALQHLPAIQRAVLILREVLGFSAKEVAEAMETSVPSVNSALQRARASIEERVPDQSQQETLRTLDDDEIDEIVKTYVDAWERNDVEAVVALLTEDAAIAMPPLASWFGPRDEFASSWRTSR